MELNHIREVAYGSDLVCQPAWKSSPGRQHGGCARPIPAPSSLRIAVLCGLFLNVSLGSLRARPVQISHNVDNCIVWESIVPALWKGSRRMMFTR